MRSEDQAARMMAVLSGSRSPSRMIQSSRKTTVMVPAKAQRMMSIADSTTTIITLIMVMVTAILATITIRTVAHHLRTMCTPSPSGRASTRRQTKPSRAIAPPSMTTVILLVATSMVISVSDLAPTATQLADPSLTSIIRSSPKHTEDAAGLLKLKMTLPTIIRTLSNASVS